MSLVLYDAYFLSDKILSETDWSNIAIFIIIWSL